MKCLFFSPAAGSGRPPSGGGSGSKKKKKKKESNELFKTAPELKFYFETCSETMYNNFKAVAHNQKMNLTYKILLSVKSCEIQAPDSGLKTYTRSFYRLIIG